MNTRLACLALVLLGFSALACATTQIEVLALFKDKALISVDGKRRFLTAGRTSPEGVKLISATSQAAVLEIGGKVGTYKLGTRISDKFEGPPPGVAVRIWPDPHGMYGVDGSINGLPIHFLVDTGSTAIAMNRNQASRLGLQYRLNGVEGHTTTASGVEKAYYLKLKTVQVGEITLHDVEAAVIDGDYPHEVLLGMSFLGRLNMSRDGSVLELKAGP